VTKTRSRVNVPNALCALRLAGCPLLLYLAAIDALDVFVGVFVVLVTTDWVDGRIARRLGQKSTFGARLDSVADAALYGTLLLAAIRLKPEVLQAEWPWIVSAAVTYAIAGAAGVVKFRRWPAYHTRSAKICWSLNAIAVVFLFADWSVWPLRIAMAAVSLANLESLVITLLIDEWRTDVSGVWRLRRRGSGPGPTHSETR